MCLLQEQDHNCPTDRKVELPGEVMRTICQVLSFHSVVLHLLQDQDYNFPMDRKVELPDDVMRTKTFVLHPTTLEQATESLEQVRIVTCYCSLRRFDCFVMRRIKMGSLSRGGRSAPCLALLAACLWAKLCGESACGESITTRAVVSFARWATCSTCSRTRTRAKSASCTSASAGADSLLFWSQAVH